MLFMNDSDIYQASKRFELDSAKHHAVEILQAHIEVINANSDGWAYWRPPVVAAKRLMELIKGPPVSETTAAECLKRALCPLRTFYTKHPTLPRPSIL